MIKMKKQFLFSRMVTRKDEVTPERWWPANRVWCRGQISRYNFRMGWILLFLFHIVIFQPVSGLSAEGEAGLWEDLRMGRSFVLLRHAIAPGIGDPENFTVGDCSTQRNLSDAGREQATAIGELFRANGIDNAKLFSSQWCRCRDTAALLKLGAVDELPYLNSFFQRYQQQDFQTRKIREWLGEQEFELPLVLVTHQVNITSLTGFYPSSGELVFAGRSKEGEISVRGSIKTGALEK